MSAREGIWNALTVRKKLTMKRIACITLGILVMSSLLGCNTQGKSEARDILKESISKMNALSSFKEADTSVISTKEGTSTETRKAEYDLSAKKGHMVRMVRTEDNISVTTWYSYGGYQYTSMGKGKWWKVKVTGVGAVLLAEITKMSKNPKSVRVVQENSTTYELGLDAKRQLVNLMLSGDMDINPKEFAFNLDKATVKAIENMSASVVLTVAKDTSYLERADIRINIAAMPEAGDMSWKVDGKFYDFNKPANIVLPKTTKSASGK